MTIKKLLVLILILPAVAFAWRPYDIFYSGSRYSGIGGSFTAWASDETALIHNPAGLIQIKSNWTFTYEVRAGVKIKRIPDPKIKADFNYLSFMALTYGKSDYRAGFFTSPVFKGSSLEMRVVGLGGSARLGEKWSAGLSAGALVAVDSGAVSVGPWVNAGAFVQPLDVLTVGFAFWLPSVLSWSGYANASKVEETTPAVFNLGLGLKTSDRSLWFADVEYIGWDWVKFEADGVSSPPKMKSLLGEKLHIHTGFTFLEEKTGAHIRFGVRTRGVYYPTGADTEIVLSLGVSAVAGKFTIEGAVEDTFLLYAFDIWNQNSGWENLTVSLKFPF